MQVLGKKLFDYQEKCINSVQQAIADGDKKLLIISLMGSGKTVIAAAMIQRFLAIGARVLFMVDLSVLTNQVIKELNVWGIPHTVLQSGYPYDARQRVVVASAQTVDAKLKSGSGNLDFLIGKVDVLLYDEAHNLSYRQVAQKVFYHYEGAIALGLTATPWRLSASEYLGQFYQRSITTLQPPDLIKMGRAVPCRIFGFEKYFDLDSIAEKKGDYDENDMARQGVTLKNLGIVYEQWKQLTHNRSTIAFCATVQHAQAVSDYFESQGVNAGCITGDTKPDERERLFEALRSGELKVLASIGVLTAGFDAPIVDTILYIRLTKSRSLYHQAVGRGARVYPGKQFFYILDFGSNYRRMGNPMSFQDYDISLKSRKHSQDWKAKTKFCPECGWTVAIALRTCPECLHEFEALPKKEVVEEEESEDEEEEFVDDMHEYFDSEDRDRLAWFRQIRKLTYSKLLHPDAAANSFKDRYGFLPPREWSLHSTLGKNPTEKAITDYRNYLDAHKPHEYWLKSMLNAELGESDVGQKRRAPKRKHKKGDCKWWLILECDRYADDDLVKQQYKKLARYWHPDICKDERGPEIMKAINNAYDAYQSIVF